MFYPAILLTCRAIISHLFNLQSSLNKMCKLIPGVHPTRHALLERVNAKPTDIKAKESLVYPLSVCSIKCGEILCFSSSTKKV